MGQILNKPKVPDMVPVTHVSCSWQDGNYYIDGIPIVRGLNIVNVDNSQDDSSGSRYTLIKGSGITEFFIQGPFGYSNGWLTVISNSSYLFTVGGGQIMSFMAWGV